MKNIVINILLLISVLLVSCSKESEKNGVPVKPANPTITTSVTDVTLPDSGSGSTSFSITSDASWSISLSDTKAAPLWCKVEPLSGNAGTTNITITNTEANESYDDRNAYIKITSGQTTTILTVTQKKKNTILLTKDKFDVNEKGGQIQIELKTNVEYSVVIPQEYASWISKGTSSATKSLENKTELFNIKEGTTDGAREGLIIFRSNDLKDTVHIYQSQKNSLILTAKEYNFSCEASSVEVELRSNVEYDVVIPASVNWVKKMETKSIKVDKLLFSIDKNAEYDYRTATIVVKDKHSSLADTLIINQSQLNALILGTNRIDSLSYCGEGFSINIKSNINYTCDIPTEATQWLSIVKTKALTNSTVNFVVNSNSDFDREAIIVFKGDGNFSDTVYVSQDGVKTILMDFYNATGGTNWRNNANWGSSKPVNEWYGMDNYGNSIKNIDLISNNLCGYIPKSFGKLKELVSINLCGNDLKDDMECLIENISGCGNLTYLNLRANKLSGKIPAAIGNFSEMESIDLSNNQLSGSIPDNICRLSKLKYLSLYSNNLTGRIPEDLGKLPLTSLFLNTNMLTGPIPTSVLSMNGWQNIMDYIINQSGYTVYPPLAYAKLPNHENKDLNLQPFKAYDIFATYKYTILYSYDYGCVWSNMYTPTVVELLDRYRSKGLGAISYHACILSEAGKLDNIRAYINRQKMDKFVNLLNIGKYIDSYGSTQWDDSYFFGSQGTPSVMVVNNQGCLVWGHSENRDKLPDFIASLLGEPDKLYQSTDFSKDGEVKTLQVASFGKGINLVIMGDGFVDKDMASGGKYEARANEAMEAIFSKEPMKSFRDRFNVYCVKAVSLDEGIGINYQTVFSAKYGDGSFISGNNDKCFNYALKVPSIKDLSNTTIITILNDSKYAGTCYMYNDNNSSIAYCPLVGYDPEQFAQIIHHEVIGHGFGKLADEYSYNSTISQSEIDSYNSVFNKSGWWSNIDFTNNSQTIKWSNFINNILYSSLVGIYEGGATYEHGVYRSTENSIMRYNEGDFNAPSRLAIYKRIMELSGQEYVYDYFIQYDALNRIVTKSQAAPPMYFVPLSPPVVVYKRTL